MRKVSRSKHRLENGVGVECITGLGGSDSEEAKGVGVEAMELAFMAEALDDGLSSGEGRGRVLIR